ncbi:hypothetical protein PR048_026480 [Dryococelus australis]|uniref:Uncharacterized protein n=1 Tax=Dryococelus australis TaxID=614101 RepID=A0ABQ9GLH3_9NEOP|nr:hypothetical protein PR048_026480 [Dryococelus australis]
MILTDGHPVYIIGIPGVCYGIRLHHRTCSPRFPESNGEAEKAVDIATHILSKSEDPNIGLLSYRCTPLDRKDLALEEKNRTIYDRKSRVKDLPILKAGDRMWITNMSSLWESPDCCRSTKVIHVWEGTEDRKLGRQTTKTVIKEELSKYQFEMNNKREVTKQGILKTTLAQQERERETSSLTEEIPFLGFPARKCEINLMSSNANTDTGERGNSDQVVRTRSGRTVNKVDRSGVMQMQSSPVWNNT